MPSPIHLQETPHGLLVIQRRSVFYYLNMIILTAVSVAVPIALLGIGFVTKYDIRCERSVAGENPSCSSVVSKLFGDPLEEYYLSNVNGVTNTTGNNSYLTSSISDNTIPIKSIYNNDIQALLNAPDRLLLEEQRFNLKGSNIAGLLCCTGIWILAMVGVLINTIFTRTMKLELDIQRREIRYQSARRLAKTTVLPLDEILFASYYTYPTIVALIFRSGDYIQLFRYAFMANANNPTVPQWAIDINDSINAWLESHNIGFHR